MKVRACRGLSLVELLVAMAVAGLAGSLVLQTVLGYQGRILAEASRNDLQDRAERLVRFLAADIRAAAFLVGAAPRLADGAPLSLVHDSLPGDPLETLPYAILAADDPGGDDRLTIVRAVSFAPPLRVALPGAPGDTALELDRRPNVAPGSSRELLPAPEAINVLALDCATGGYTVQVADRALQISPPLTEPVHAGTELLGVRASTLLLEAHAGGKRLRRDDFTSREILDDAVDGLQFEYLLADGALVDQPDDPLAIRGVKISLLVRDLRPDRAYAGGSAYTLGNRSYGPFADHYRRCLVTQLVEVKNHGLP